MAYKLTLIEDNGSFDKWGASNIRTLKTQSFDDSYGYLENGCQSTIKLWNIAKQWLQDADIRDGEGWVEVSQNGEIINKIVQ